MNAVNAFHIAVYILIGVAGLTFISLFFVTAPYGRFTTKKWGALVSNRFGWFMMEVPASLLFAVYFFLRRDTGNLVLIAFFLIWESHYFYRGFIFPLRQSEKKMSLLVAFMGLFFNAMNTFVQGYWLYFLAPADMYQLSWFWDPRFIAGLALFITGCIINRRADSTLFKIRKEAKGYQIPYGGLYERISCPNYFGEIVEWIGWAILTWCWAGGLFAIWTFANLAPRALATHRWYKATFPEYPMQRKALVPYLL